MKEIELVEAYNDNFTLNWAYTHTLGPNFDGQRLEESLTSSSYSFVKNIFVFVGFVIEGLKKARASKQQPGRPQAVGDSLDCRAVKLLKKLMINGTNLI